MLFQFPLHRDPRCNCHNPWSSPPVVTLFQFPLHRDPRCNHSSSPSSAPSTGFQFPLHRDPRCNLKPEQPDNEAMRRFSSLYIGILAATLVTSRNSRRLARFSSLYIGILAATLLISFFMFSQVVFQFPLHRDPRCNHLHHMTIYAHISFSSLYIGILAATVMWWKCLWMAIVSVPFTSGSSLQP